MTLVDHLDGWCDRFVIVAAPYFRLDTRLWWRPLPNLVPWNWWCTLASTQQVVKPFLCFEHDQFHDHWSTSNGDSDLSLGRYFCCLVWYLHRLTFVYASISAMYCMPALPFIPPVSQHPVSLGAVRKRFMLGCEGPQASGNMTSGYSWLICCLSVFMSTYSTSIIQVHILYNPWGPNGRRLHKNKLK